MFSKEPCPECGFHVHFREINSPNARRLELGLKDWIPFAHRNEDAYGCSGLEWGNKCPAASKQYWIEKEDTND